MVNMEVNFDLHKQKRNSMDYPIYTSSPKALKLIQSYQDDKGTSVNTHHSSKYKFEQLAIGFSFAVPIAEGKETSLRRLATEYGKKLGKKFSVLKHQEIGMIEVARIG